MVRHQSRTLNQRKGTSANQQGNLTQERRTQKPHPIRMQTKQFDTGYAHTEKAGDPKEKHSNVRCLTYEEFRTAKAVTNQVENLSSELWEAEQRNGMWPFNRKRGNHMMLDNNFPGWTRLGTR